MNYESAYQRAHRIGTIISSVLTISLTFSEEGGSLRMDGDDPIIGHHS